MRTLPALVTAACGLLTAGPLWPADRPNILWILSDDNSAGTIGAYGNALAQTPHIDALARDGHRYTQAHANSPVCAPARSTLMTGVAATTQGTHQMRSRYELPAPITPFVTLLRAAGYYCTNLRKTDFNFAGDDKAYWDECGPQADYRRRSEGQPFFAVLNFGVSHEQFLHPERIDRMRREGFYDAAPMVDPAAVRVPAYLPDLPVVREELSLYHELVRALDRDVGTALARLAEDPGAADTIVFYFSDHGGLAPRAKRYLYASGTHVPLVVHLPERWRHLAPGPVGEPVDRLVSFVDFAPTALSLAGLKPLPFMEGKAFLGPATAAPNAHAFLSADRFDETYSMTRGVTDGRYRYLRNFHLEKPRVIQAGYAFRNRSWQAWRDLAERGDLTGPPADLWSLPTPAEELYDTAADPDEVRNLAADPAQEARLATLRGVLRERMLSAPDLGLIPEAMYPELTGGGQTVYRLVRTEGFPTGEIVDLAFLTGRATDAARERFIGALGHASPIVRYWALRGLATAGEPFPAEAVRAKLADPAEANRLWAAFLLARHDTAPELRARLAAARDTPSHPVVGYLATSLLRSLDGGLR